MAMVVRSLSPGSKATPFIVHKRSNCVGYSDPERLKLKERLFTVHVHQEISEAKLFHWNKDRELG